MEHDIGADDAFAEGAMHEAEVAGRKILVARVGGTCRAVAATCPHAGASLGQGVLRDGVVICPWHKAAFSMATGALVEPPAVDPVESFPLRVADGRLMVTVADQPDAAAPAPDAADTRCMAIIGAGAAGAVAAQTLREEGFAGRVVLIGEEAGLPYDRTILSKYALSGKTGGEKTPLQDEAFYTRHRIERLTLNAKSVDPAARTVKFANGTSLEYDAALLATGGLPRPPEVPGHDLEGVYLLRSAEDAGAIVRAADTARQVVVIGAGFIGLEAAASLRERGLAVAVVAPQDAPLEAKLGPAVGNVFRRVHEREGIVFHLGEEVAAIEGNGRVERVRLKSGKVLPAEVVVAGLGIVPAADLLAGVERRKDGGLDVDARLQVTAGLYAAGDIAAFPLYGDGERIRVEHWRVAQQHGRVAARNMLGHGVPYVAVPYFWTIHFLKRLDYVGHAATWDEVVIDGDIEKPDFCVFYVEAGTVKAVAGWGRDQQMALAIALMTERRTWTVADLRRALAG